MTLNLAQLLCVLQREENWSRERTARRAQPAASPAGIKKSAPPPSSAAAPGIQRRRAPGPASRNRGRCKRGIKANGENGAERRGTDDRGGSEKVGKDENLQSGGLKRREARFLDVKEDHSLRKYFV